LIGRVNEIENVLFAGNTQTSRVCRQVVEFLARGSRVYLLESLVELFHVFCCQPRVFRYATHVFLHVGVRIDERRYPLLCIVKEFRYSRERRDSSHPFIAEISQLVSYALVFFDLLLLANLLQFLLGTLERLGVGVPLLRSAFYGARIELSIDLANCLLQLLRRLLVHASQTVCKRFHTVLRALQFSGALSQLGTYPLEHFDGAFPLCVCGVFVAQYLLRLLLLPVQLFHLLSELLNILLRVFVVDVEFDYLDVFFYHNRKIKAVSDLLRQRYR
jgi:hypothetical protein